MEETQIITYFIQEPKFIKVQLQSENLTLNQL